MDIHQATTPRNSTIADHGHTPPARQPESPDCERRKGRRQPQPQPGPRQIRIVDGQGGPCDEQGPEQKTDYRDQPAEKSGQKPAKRIQWLLPLVSTAERTSGVAHGATKRISFHDRTAEDVH